MITVVLLKPQNPDNIGFICRSMANFDLKKLIIIEPYCDLDHALKTSKHAKSILKNAVIQPYNYFQKLNFPLIVGTTSVIGTDYNIPRTPLTIGQFVDKLESQKTAIILGNEGTGLSNEEIKKCDFLITIPASKKYSALNISHAAAIIFYEIYKKHGNNKLNSHIAPISYKEKTVIMEKFSKILDTVEFQTPHKKETQAVTWEKIFNQAMMSKREAHVVIGLLNKLNKNLSD